MRKIVIVLLMAITSNLSAQIPNKLTNNDKVYILSKVWSEIQRNFVFYDRLDFDWDSTYVSNLERLDKTKNDYEFYLLMQEFVSSAKDGHTNFYLPGDAYKYLRGIPLRTRMIENSVIITKVNNDSLLKQGIEVGMEIIRINDLSPSDYANKFVAPYVSASTKQDLLNRVYDYNLFYGPRMENIKLEIKNSSGKSNVFVVNRNMKSKRTKKHNISFDVIEKNTGLLTINNFYSKDFIEEFDSVFKKILLVDNLIIDLRNNDGGSSTKAYYVLQHLTNKPFYGSSWRTRKYMPAFISWNYNEDWHTEEADTVEVLKVEKFVKPVVLLTSVRTFSAAEDFTVAFKQMGKGKIIGQTTGGSTGNPIVFSFKDGSWVRICTKEDFFANGEKFIGVGIKPDIYVKSTIQDFQNKKDIELAKAIEVLVL